jgi:hypothetical protein
VVFIAFSVKHQYAIAFSVSHQYVIAFSVSHQYVIAFSVIHQYVITFSVTHQYVIAFSVSHQYVIAFSGINEYISVSMSLYKATSCTTTLSVPAHYNHHVSLPHPGMKRAPILLLWSSGTDEYIFRRTVAWEEIVGLS